MGHEKDLNILAQTKTIHTAAETQISTSLEKVTLTGISLFIIKWSP